MRSVFAIPGPSVGATPPRHTLLAKHLAQLSNQSIEVGVEEVLDSACRHPCQEFNLPSNREDCLEVRIHLLTNFFAT